MVAKCGEGVNKGQVAGMKMLDTSPKKRFNLDIGGDIIQADPSSVFFVGKY